MSKILGQLTLKEINQQPLSFGGVRNNIEDICSKVNDIFDKIKPEEIIFTGCGTSYYLAQSASAIFSHYNNISSRAVVCSELFLYGDIYFKEKRILLVPITRASETTEVRMAIEHARSRSNVFTMAVTCDNESSKINDYFLLSPNAKEESIVMTSSFTSMLYIILVMSLCLSDNKNMLEKIKLFPEISSNLIEKYDSEVKSIIEDNKETDLFICLGQGPMYGIACEAMLKLKEMSISNSEAYRSLEYRHGPISLVKPGTLVTIFASDTALDYELKLAQEIKALGGKVIMVCESSNETIKESVDYIIEIGYPLDEFLRAPLAIIPAHFIAYYWALNKGIDSDAPRNLAHAIVL